MLHENVYVSVVSSKMPEREDDHLTPATRLLEKRREMSEVEQSLGAQKEVLIFGGLFKTNNLNTVPYLSLSIKICRK